MSVNITMPQLGESVTEGTVIRWLKRPGDEVARYEALLEVVTDKVDTAVPSPATGVLLEIIVPEGDTVRVGTVLARVGVPVSNGAPPPTLAAEADQYAGESGAQLPNAIPGFSAPAPNRAPTPINGQRIRLTPVVARMVAAHRLDVGQIPGSGASGRVIKRDVLRYMEQRGGDKAQMLTVPAAAMQSPSPTPIATPAPVHTAPPTAPLVLNNNAKLVPLTPMRRSIAEHMVNSMQAAPQVTNVFEVDLNRIVAHRAANKGAFERQGVRLTFTAYFFHAAAIALRAVPTLNGRYTDAGIVLNRRCHIGMAVALDQGLIVPVIKDADEKNLLGLARAVNDLAERARTRKLRPDDTQGGTFTITNHGTSGSLFGTPVINQPQSAILGIGAMVKRPMVVTQDGQDLIAIRPMSYLSLTFDHRLIDGSAADAFLTAVKDALERYV